MPTKSDILNSIASALNVELVAIRWLDNQNKEHLEALRDIIVAATGNGAKQESRTTK